MTNDGLSSEQILMYASGPAGYADPGADCHPNTARRLVRLVCEGYVEQRVRTVDLPEVAMPESCKAVAMFDTWSARTITLTTYHTVRWPAVRS